MKSKALIISASLVALTAPVLADGRADYYQQFAKQRFFDQQSSARSIAMAGAPIATTMDSSSVLGNPAGIGFMKDAEISGNYTHEMISGNDLDTYEDIESDRDNGYAVGAFPISPYLDALPENGNIGLGWSGERFDGEDSNNSDSRVYGIHAAYAKALNDRWSLGYGITYKNDDVNTDSYDYEMTDGVRQTVGFQNKVKENFTWGSSFFYGFGQGSRDLVDGSALADFDLSSWGADLGATTKLGSTTIAYSADYTNYSTNGGSFITTSETSEDGGADAFGFRLGAEQPINDWLALRAGYRYMANLSYDFPEVDGLEGTEKFNAVSFGAGFKLHNVNVSYGAEYRALANDDWTHSVNLSVPFSLCKNETK